MGHFPFIRDNSGYTIQVNGSAQCRYLPAEDGWQGKNTDTKFTKSLRVPLWQNHRRQEDCASPTITLQKSPTLGVPPTAIFRRKQEYEHKLNSKG